MITLLPMQGISEVIFPGRKIKRPPGHLWIISGFLWNQSSRRLACDGNFDSTSLDYFRTPLSTLRGLAAMLPTG